MENRFESERIPLQAALAGAGSHAAFEELALSHTAKLYRVSLRILKNKEDAEDNVQNTLLKAFVKIRQFKGNARFSTWLVSIAINEALMAMRRTRPIREVALQSGDGGREVGPGFPELKDVQPNPEQALAARETVDKALVKLPRTMREDFLLQKLEGWTNRELAAKRGTRARMMKARMFRARCILRRRVALLRSL